MVYNFFGIGHDDTQRGVFHENQKSYAKNVYEFIICGCMQLCYYGIKRCV